MLINFLKKSWIWLFILFAIIGGYNDVRTFCIDTFSESCPFQPQLRLTFDRQEAAVETELTLFYELPNYGYFSLWNKNASGVTTRFYPKSLPIIHVSNTSQPQSMRLNQQNNTGKQTLRPTAANAEEDVIVIWSKNKLIDPPKSKYISSAAFKDYLQMHKNDLKTSMISIQITD